MYEISSLSQKIKLFFYFGNGFLFFVRPTDVGWCIMLCAIQRKEIYVVIDLIKINKKIKEIKFCYTIMAVVMEELINKRVYNNIMIMCVM